MTESSESSLALFRGMMPILPTAITDAGDIDEAISSAPERSSGKLIPNAEPCVSLADNSSDLRSVEVGG